MRIGNDGQQNNTTQIELDNTIEPNVSWFNDAESPIYINAIATGFGAQNWTWARAQQWCRVGDGTEENPYRIENITIDAGASGSGIHIQNSHDVYFIIQNCTVTNAGSTYHEDGGIKIDSSQYGTVKNNELTGNGFYGIFLLGSRYIVVSENIVNENGNTGIGLYQSCENNTIFNNKISNQGGYAQDSGIVLDSSCQFNLIDENMIYKQDYGGILVDDSEFNIISNNNIFDSSGSHQDMGIYIAEAANNTLINNEINAMVDHGIWLTGSKNNSILYNTAYNNGNGITIELGSDDNTVSHNTVFNDYSSLQQIGINIDDSDENVIHNNTAYNNQIAGIFIDGSSKEMHVTENKLYSNTYGIFIAGSEESEVYLNFLYGNGKNAQDSGFKTVWDVEGRGNFWGNFTGTDIDLNGIGDQPISLDGIGDGVDHFPLIHTFTSAPTNQEIEVGTEGIQLSWAGYYYKPWSGYAMKYDLYENSALVASGYISSHKVHYEIEYEIPSNMVGTYAYRLELESNFTLINLVEVSVTNTAPIIQTPLSTIIYEVGTIDQVFAFNLTDPSVNNPTYTLYRDEIVVATEEPCSMEEPIIVDISGLYSGEYAYKIEVGDGFGGSNSKIISIKVENTAPVITVTTTNTTYIAGGQDQTLEWKFVDPSVDSPSYSIYREGELILDSIAVNVNTIISVPVEGLTTGTYAYQIDVHDGYGQTTSEIVWIRVLEDAGAAVNEDDADGSDDAGEMDDNADQSVTDTILGVLEDYSTYINTIIMGIFFLLAVRIFRKPVSIIVPPSDAKMATNSDQPSAAVKSPAKTLAQRSPQGSAPSYTKSNSNSKPKPKAQPKTQRKTTLKKSSTGKPYSPK